MSDTVMNIRLPSDLKKAFDLVAKELDLTSSQLLRHMMRDAVAQYMTRNAQGDLLGASKPSGHTKTPPKAKKQAKGSGNPLFDQLIKRV